MNEIAFTRGGKTHIGRWMLIEVQRKAIETTEIEARLDALEERQR